MSLSSRQRCILKGGGVSSSSQRHHNLLSQWLILASSNVSSFSQATTFSCQLGKMQAWLIFTNIYVASAHWNGIRFCADRTLLTLGHMIGDLKVLWTRGEPERPCPHVHLQPSSL
ncbi:hypothetical protein ACFX1S_041072 [Malus domestica]